LLKLSMEGEHGPRASGVANAQAFVRTTEWRLPEAQLVYEIIECMHPALPKLELFARGRREGWSAWGNQAAASPAGSSAMAARSMSKDG